MNFQGQIEFWYVGRSDKVKIPGGRESLSQNMKIESVKCLGERFVK